MQKLLFMVHPDFFTEGSPAHSNNAEAVKTLNSYIDGHRDLLDERDDEAPSPSPAALQPTALKLFLRAGAGGKKGAGGGERAIDVVLHSPSRSQPRAFQQTMDRLFKVVGLEAVFAAEAGAGGGRMAFRKGSVGWLARREGAALREAVRRQREEERAFALASTALLRVHLLRASFPAAAVADPGGGDGGAGGGKVDGGGALPGLEMGAKTSLLWELTRLLCEHEAAAAASARWSPHARACVCACVCGVGAGGG
jgi:hypothetical protein